MYVDVPNLINLSAVQGIGPTRLKNLIAKFRSAEKVFKARIEELIAVEGIDLKIAKNIKSFSNDGFGAEQYNKLLSIGGQIITFWDDNYPLNLKKIYDPPVLLFVKGDFKKDDDIAIGIVGTRMPSNYGKMITEKLTRELSKLGMTIISGLARGIDTVSHIAAMKAFGRTHAVIGSGLDVIYPAENKKLAHQISEHGALISEFPLGTGPDAVNFPRRNRIIAGLSLGVVVVEAGEKSGALITSDFALENNREVFAVPGNITSSKSKGSNRLIKEGAKLITSVDDIVEELAPHLKRLSTEMKPNAAIESLNRIEKEVLTDLSDTPVHIDSLAREMKKSTGEILSNLLSLEFKDIVKQLPGKLFVKI